VTGQHHEQHAQHHEQRRQQNLLVSAGFSAVAAATVPLDPDVLREHACRWTIIAGPRWPAYDPDNWWW
jgi:hypothetical protein